MQKLLGFKGLLANDFKQTLVLMLRWFTFSKLIYTHCARFWSVAFELVSPFQMSMHKSLLLQL